MALTRRASAGLWVAVRVFFRSRLALTVTITVTLLSAVMSAMASVATFVDERVEGFAGIQVPPRGLRVLLEGGDAGLPACAGSGAVVTRVAVAKLGSEDRRYVETMLVATNVTAYLDVTGYRLKGAVPEGPQIVIGSRLASLLGAGVGDRLALVLGGRRVDVTVAGVMIAQGIDDLSVIVQDGMLNVVGAKPLATVVLIRDGLRPACLAKLSGAHVSSASVNFNKTVAGLREFVRGFLHFWYAAALPTLALSTYAASLKLATGTREHLTALEVLGGREVAAFYLMSLMGLASALGATLGTSLGLVSAQVASKSLEWFNVIANVRPALTPSEFVKLVGITFVSSFAAGLSAALRSAIKGSV